MDTVNQLLQDAVISNTIAGCACVAIDRDGVFKYANAVGARSATKAPLEPITTESTFSLISSTKIMTAIAALQLVERGALSLDQDVSALLPELANQPVLAGHLDAPVPVPRRNPLLLRYLLTHSIGIPYPGFADVPVGYAVEQWRDLSRYTTIAKRFGHPLAFEPGESFGYGGAMDWVSKLVERVSGEPSLDHYMRKHIWGPLGIQGITFWPNKHPEIKSTMVETVQRTADGGYGPSTARSINQGIEECFGGQGAHANVDDFLKILHSLLADDGKLLKPKTVAEMFKPQLTAPAKEALNKMLHNPEKAAMVLGDFSKPAATYDWNCGGLIATNDGSGKRGATTWYSMLNFYWFIDVEAGLCGAFGTQLLPMGDRKVNDLIIAWKDAMYEGLSKTKEKSQYL
ncbi:uncharacterized protein K452DRAFT_257480 [Aplosporella prunicola CBS 121167]|uniref:Beta-lactamase-related domain-containing protein n=1 Tax=Aplosporella prunicola CBS 121167 TaxID=1176127 RepID=A0A6A6B384_9PEZI|nr:uncharacterized protein K452DRAFT_257480 [Aplosporella prunicola CBS 121167]KAF2137447.1 hypothetical protein K452DRAFT_257480 [Aplosporella prunicola CBS 121167]